MKVIVTAGPSYEPIDQVRRLTNFSTGELGVLLSEELSRAGLEVFCLKGVMATYPGPAEPCHLHPFTTNEDLLTQLSRLARENDIAAFFHVAALCDFKMKRVEDDRGAKQDSPKIDSRSGSLRLVLEPAKKIIGDLRGLFPRSFIVGWKYELAGTKVEALRKAWQQLQDNSTNACVLNGKAYGAGFALCTLPDQLLELRDKAEVARFLPTWLLKRISSTASQP
jgi:phosphopantothenoylcysteine synthetase/decarboxylase